MDFTHVTAGEDDGDRRLDRILRSFLDDASLSQIYKSMRKGLIKVNGKKCQAGTKIYAGDDIAIASFLCAREQSPSAPQAAATKSALAQEQILFRNEHILILNKPYDMPVQPSGAGDREKALSTAVERDFTCSNSRNTSIAFKTGPLHRLDRKTTGAICFSQSLKGAHWFSKAMQEHKIAKYYLALLSGTLEAAENWTDMISKDPGQRQSFKTVRIGSEEAAAKEALTQTQPLATGSYQGRPVTLVQCRIQTGRTHQIRAQAAAHGHPLLGDTAYGAPRLQGCGQDFFLHAYELHFADDACGLPPLIKAPIMTFFQKMLDLTLIKWDGRLIV